MSIAASCSHPTWNAFPVLLPKFAPHLPLLRHFYVYDKILISYPTIRSFNKYLLSDYYIPGTVLGSEQNTCKSLPFWNLSSGESSTSVHSSAEIIYPRPIPWWMATRWSSQRPTPNHLPWVSLTHQALSRHNAPQSSYYLSFPGLCTCCPSALNTLLFFFLWFILPLLGLCLGDTSFRASPEPQVGSGALLCASRGYCDYLYNSTDHTLL